MPDEKDINTETVEETTETEQTEDTTKETESKEEIKEEDKTKEEGKEEEEDYDPLRQKEEVKKETTQQTEEEIADEDQVVINKAVQKATQPLIVAQEVDQYLSQKPELAQYRQRIINTLIQVPQLKVDAAARAVIPDSVLIKMGAKMQKDADVEAGKTRTGGDSKRATPVGSIPDINNMNKEERNLLYERVIGGQKI